MDGVASISENMNEWQSEQATNLTLIEERSTIKELIVKV